MTDQGTVQPKSFNWLLAVIIFAVVGWVGFIFCGYSYKEVFKKLHEAESVHNESVTFKIPVEIGGKTVYKIMTKTVHDTSKVKDQQQTEKIYKSGFDVGPAVSTKGNFGLLAGGDILPLGPGTIQLHGLISKDEDWAIASYRLLF